MNIKGYMRLICNDKLLTPDEQAALARRMRAAKGSGNTDEYLAARDEMITRNLRLVVSAAQIYRSQDRDVADIIQAGNLGLMRAIESYDPDRGSRFSVYAHSWIKKAIRTHIVDDKPISTPQHVPQRAHRVNSARDKYRTIHGKDPEQCELTTQTGLSAVQIHNVLSSATTTISLHEGIHRTDELTVGDTLAHPGPSALEDYEDTERISKISEILSSLTPQQEFVMRAKFGFCEDDRIDTVSEMGVSADIERKIRVSAIESLKASHGHVLRELMS